MSQPIGVFDSGVGGLSVAHEVRRALPGEDLLYFADTAHCPYGDRPLPEVRERALAVARHLESAAAKLLVVACNTATGAALEAVRAAVRVPVVGLEPAVKIAAARTRAGRVGVMATAGTLASERFARLVAEHARGVHVVPQPCPGLVELIEEGELHGPRLTRLLNGHTASLRQAGVDVVVLGCTHYPFVRAPLARVMGPEVELVDSGPAIARRTASLLGSEGRASGRGRVDVLTTGDPGPLASMVERLWGERLRVERVDVPSPHAA